MLRAGLRSIDADAQFADMDRLHIVAGAQCVHPLGYAVDDLLTAKSRADDFFAGNAVQDRNDRRIRTDLVAGCFDRVIQLGSFYG